MPRNSALHSISAVLIMFKHFLLTLTLFRIENLKLLSFRNIFPAFTQAFQFFPAITLSEVVLGLLLLKWVGMALNFSLVFKIPIFIFILLVRREEVGISLV